ncbi:MAG: SDR family NAD(P)-dependent oxidoreductase [Calditrichaeota bacterium]|nr:SDR family NAD(P)-dependent oxidoreductase [Candidatus Cloacimonadota bacterium]MCB1048219.1 SDR family NAD(P)-dependent oxidoreductase [Calditrichota bacterium]
MNHTPPVFDNRDWALITGASGTLGKAMARKAAAAGLGLLLSSRDEPALHALALELRVLCGDRCLVLPVDLASPNGAELLLQDLRERSLRVRLLVHAANSRLEGTFLDEDPITQADWLQLNQLSLLQLCRGLGPAMVGHGWARILAIVPEPGASDSRQVLARAGQDWIERFVIQLNEELAGQDVRIASWPRRGNEDPDTMAADAWARLLSTHDTPAARAGSANWLGRLLARILPR